MLHGPVALTSLSSYPRPSAGGIDALPSLAIGGDVRTRTTSLIKFALILTSVGDHIIIPDRPTSISSESYAVPTLGSRTVPSACDGVTHGTIAPPALPFLPCVPVALPPRHGSR